METSEKKKEWFTVTVRYSRNKMDKICRTQESDAIQLREMYKNLYPNATITLQKEYL